MEIMSTKILCRLCVSVHEEYKSLYDENGQGNNIYEVTLKYFDPMLLTPDSAWDSTVICALCWHHINDFHSFQQTILNTQSNLQTLLQADVKEHVIEVKSEDTSLDNHPVAIKAEDATSKQELHTDTPLSIVDDYQDIVPDDNHFESSDEDDMKPLIYHLTKTKERSIDSKTKENVKTVNRKNVRNSKTSLKKEKPNKDLKTNPKRKSKQRPDNQQITKTSADEQDDSSAETSNNDKKQSNNKTLEWDNFIAQWKHELDCLYCTSTVENFTLLRKHYRSHHPKEKLYVKCCDRRFSKRFTLFEHIQLHINPKIFECDVCGKCSTSSSNLAKHKKELHTEEGKLRPFECNVCHKNFTSKTNLRIHTEVHESSRDHICSECGKGFPSENRRKIHERMVHNVDRICDQCGKSVHGIYALRQHLLEHKGVEKTKWPCDICGAQLNSHSSRKRHKQLKHNDGTTAYICSDCGKVYTSEPALMGHKRMAHTRELNFKCDYCEKAFKTPRNLREHTATHTGIDIYQCPHCPRTFKMSSNMHHHRKKVHPKEWAEGRVNKRTNKINLSLVSNEVVI